MSQQDISNKEFKVVVGKVVDANQNNAPIPFATVSSKNAKYGVITDFDGNFSLSIPKSMTRLQASSVGYKLLELQVPIEAMDSLIFYLKTEAFQMETVEVTAKKRVRYKRKNNPSIWLVNQVIANKTKNHFSQLDSFNLKRYSKFSADITNFKDKTIKCI